MSANNKSINHLLVWLPYIVLAIFYALNLSWNITDHDDGHTLGYHAMGRDELIQRSYGTYDSMCDFLLGFLPINYKLLIGVMVGSTVVASFAILYFSGKLLQKWFSFSNTEIAIAQLLFIFSMPEFIYMGFSFKSVYISLSIVLASSHLLFKNINSKISILTAAFIFGLGISFRWNMLMLGAPIASMLLWELKKEKNWINAVTQTALWGVTSLLVSILFVYFSGYSPERIVKTYLWGKEYAEKTDFQLIARVGDLSLFFTPATAFLFLLGIIHVLKTRIDFSKFILLFATTSFAVAAVSIAPSFKFLAPLWICFMALFAFGYKYISQSAAFDRKIQLTILSITLFTNWFIGIQINTPSSNWGPGLNAKDTIEDMSIFSKNLGTDNRFKFDHIKIGFFDGFALPTSEGYRPLYGHAYALLGGKLSHLDEKLNRESDYILQQAKNSNTLIYQDRINPYLLASYLRSGYQTKEAWNKPTPFTKRTFTNGIDSITELRIANPKELFELDSFIHETESYDSIYLMFTFTSSCNKLLYDMNEKHGYRYRKLGPMSAVLWTKKENE